jgi:Xaa-Pro aminopeptidase
MQTNEKLQQLRDLMKAHHIDVYLVPSADFHESEYVGEHFKARAYLSGFTGSAGTVVVTQQEAGLWTDGRYFIQAAEQLQGSEIKLFKSGEPGVPTVEAYIEDVMPEKGTLGFDGRVVNAKQGKALSEQLKNKKVSVVYDQDLVGQIWADRPSLPLSQAFILDLKYCGKSFKEKLEALHAAMCEKKATTHILTTLDDIAWLFNLRGHDIAYNPVVMAYAVMTLDETFLFIEEKKITPEVRAYLDDANVKVCPYEAIYEFVTHLASNEKVLLDVQKVNYAIYSNLPSGVTVINAPNPVMQQKAVKNEVELENIRRSHIKDGVAFTKFMYWLKTNISKTTITERSAAQKLEDFRREQVGFVEPSFDTISAYKAHAALMHYSATEASDATLAPHDLYLVDSGGQYYEGTTDITRTIALGPVETVQKRHFTAVVRGMLGLSGAKFLQGVKGYNLDILARAPIWALDLDYKCGTGHGIGYFLNVHEAPNGFRWKIVPERQDSCELEVGMVTTNEPGIYIEGSHGIRIENELVVQKGEANEYGQFLHFETVTLAPIDPDAILAEEMTPTEKNAFNAYHEKVYEKISPYLNEAEKTWLYEITRPLA